MTNWLLDQLISRAKIHVDRLENSNPWLDLQVYIEKKLQHARSRFPHHRRKSEYVVVYRKSE